MKNLISGALHKKTVIYFITFLLFVGGIASFFTLGQLEDPTYTVKTAIISTRYPGASPTEVELEVTDRIELALQQMKQIKKIKSTSRSGESIITVDIKPEYWADRLPQVWDEMRKKVSDVTPTLPPGTQKPEIIDDFGAVYGFVLALSGKDYSYKELESYAKLLKKELSLVPGVSRIELWGVQPKVIYLDISEKQLSELKITPHTIAATLKEQNVMVDPGFVEDGEKRYRLAPTGEFTTPEEIGDLILRPTASDIIANLILAEKEGINLSGLEKVIAQESSNVIRIKDVATVRSGYLEPPLTLLHYDGKPAIGIQIAGAEDANLVDVGTRLYAKVETILAHLPVGLEINKIAWQSDLVEEAVNHFLHSLLLALAIVLIVLIIPSGLRMGLIIGFDLILAILGTFIVMSLLHIPLQRMSLGALIIALGMMVDNSIVIADGIAVKMRQKMAPLEAAFETAYANLYPLLVATLIAVLTFYPIYASQEDAGEYCRSLFLVVAVSLLLSWVIAIFITPLQCVDFLRASPQEKQEFHTPFFQRCRRSLASILHFRYLTLFLLLALLVASFIGFGFVRQMFFPDSTRPQLMIDYWGSSDQKIQRTADEIALMEKAFLADPSVTHIASFIGSGPPRFYLPIDPEKTYPNYGELILDFKDHKEINDAITRFSSWAEEHLPGSMIRFRKFGVGPGDAWKFELRISGPGEAPLSELRRIGTEIKHITESSNLGENWRLDMQEPVLKIVTEYDQKRGRWAGISRQDLAHAMKRSYDGKAIGLYREKEDLYPIILRNSNKEREDLLDTLSTLQIKAEDATTAVPLSQVANRIETKWEEPLIQRFNRRRAVAVQGSPKPGVTYAELKADVLDKIKKVSLPPGYSLFWDGEDDSTHSAKRSLFPGMIPAAILILLLLVSLFNAIRPVLIILVTIPFAMIGVTLGLLLFHLPFGFMALLGAMSLVGMMNKNIVVLLDACQENLSMGMSHYHAIIEASLSRARPVLLAACTTILGVTPLLPDLFWSSMAVTIMVGLAFGSLLTLVAVPLFYLLFYRVKEEN